MSGLVISVLGSPTVEVDGDPVQVDTRKATALLVYLAVTSRTQSRDRISGLLWPEYDQERARAALRRTLSSLRKALGDRWVSADRLGISLDLDGVDLDVRTFRGLLEEAERHSHPDGETCAACVAALTRAVEAFGGSFLQGFSLRDADPFDEWHSLESESLERELAAALDRLTRAQVAQGDLEAAVEVARRKLALDPLNEPAHRQLMQLYAWRGMRTAALQQYRECVGILDRELGVSPLGDTTALYEAIGEGVVQAVEQTQLSRPEPAGPRPLPGDHPLRGRAHEWDLLHEAYAAAGPGGLVVVVEGEAGIGKTRLGRDFLVAVSGRGATTVTARCYEGESGLPYALISQLLAQSADRIPVAGLEPAVLAEAARLVPSLLPDQGPAGSVDDPGALSRFFEALRQVLVAATGGERPGVMFLDDLQWCDPASLDVLGYIARRLDDTPLCIVVGWRTEEVEPGHPLRKIAGDAAGAGPGRHLVLRRLARTDVQALVEDTRGLGVSSGEELAARLMEETEGIPFFVVEYLAMLASRGGEWEMPRTIKELLRSRAGLAGQMARQILGAAAVIDRSFDFDTVWRAGGRTELETVDALDELVRHGLVVPSPSSPPTATYEFSHQKLRSFVYESMSPARRRVLHRRVAEAFVAASRGADQFASTPALVARHYELGGMEAEAARYHEAAAIRAREVYANRDALAHYVAALALGHPDPALLHEGAGDMYVLLGEYKNAVDSFEKAAALAAVDAIPILEHKLGEVHLRRGDFDLSQSHFVTALEKLGPRGDPVVEARVLAGMSFNAHRNGEIDEAAALAIRALDAATASGDPPALARAHNQLGILENARGRHAEARAHLRQSLALAEELADFSGRAAALNNLALAARSENDVMGALELTREALEICAQQGDRHREAALRNNMADLLHELGDTEGAMRELKQATATLAEIGEEPTGLLPEVWKLVEW
ncbi:MAG: AAA family ATPase [Actinomycetota bacterium]|nr:AAA family ATPase [Actinomycetota bacterium]